MMADEDKARKQNSIDYGGVDKPLDKGEMAYAQLLGEERALAQKHKYDENELIQRQKYESTPSYKVKKYVTPMRSFSRDVLGVVGKIPKYEHEVRAELGKTRGILKGVSDEERRVESDLSKSLDTDEWDMWDDKPKKKASNANKYGEDWSGLDWKI
jgi:hypothetical protein